MESATTTEEWQIEAFTAYLQPLLKKHEMDQEVTYEDLTSSWQAVNATLGKILTTVDDKTQLNSLVCV
jgi:hypothetical protein